MKKSIFMIALVMVFGLFCSTSLWAGNGKGVGMGDGSMHTVDLTNTIEISGIVSDAGVSGSGLTVDEGAGVFTTVYGMGSVRFWDSLDVAKPAIGETVSIDAVEVIFSDGSTRLIAVSLTVNDTFVTLRTENGPAWRGINKQGGGVGTVDCSACPNSENCGQAQGKGTGNCPLTTE